MKTSEVFVLSVLLGAAYSGLGVLALWIKGCWHGESPPSKSLSDGFFSSPARYPVP